MGFNGIQGINKIKEVRKSNKGEECLETEGKKKDITPESLGKSSFSTLNFYKKYSVKGFTLSWFSII